jgi:hypothetical protein
MKTFDGDTKGTTQLVNKNKKVKLSVDSNWDVPTGTVTIKIDQDRVLRVMMRAVGPKTFEKN